MVPPMSIRNMSPFCRRAWLGLPLRMSPRPRARVRNSIVSKPLSKNLLSTRLFYLKLRVADLASRDSIRRSPAASDCSAAATRHARRLS